MKYLKPTPSGVLSHPYRLGRREYLGIALPVMVTLGAAPRLVSETELWDTVAQELPGYALDAGLPKHHAEFLVCARTYERYCDEDNDNATRVAASVAGRTKTLNVSGDRHWDDRAASVPFMPVDPTHPQRSALYGELDQRWLEEDCPGFPRTTDPRYFNVAPSDQQFPEWPAMPDGLAYEFVHLHPDYPRLTGALPALRGRSFVQRHDDALIDVPLRLTTVWFIPHRERAVMIFHGSTPIDEFDAQDVRCLMLALEDAGAPRPREHYERIFALRMDRERGALHSLRDTDLVADKWLHSYVGPFDAPTPEHPLRQRMLQRARQQVAAQQAAQDSGTRALDAAAFTDEAWQPVKAAQLAEQIEQLRQQAAAERAALETKRQALEDVRRAARPDTSTQALDRARCGPPAPIDPLSASRPSIAARKPKDVPSTIASGAADTHPKLREAYLHTVQHQDAAPRLAPASAESLRERIAELHARGASLEGFDLTGADLSGMDLPGARLSGAMMESADLRGANLSGAILQRVVLARTSLERTVFTGADLRGSNLSLSACEHTDFTDAVLDDCVFERVSFEHCRFAGASIDATQFAQCSYREVDFARSRLSRLVWIGQSFEAASFRDATVRKVAFLQCRLPHADFSGADIEGLVLVDTDATGIRFERATIRKAAFSKDVTLECADFSDALLAEVNLRGAKAPHATFARASIRQSDLSDAQLRGARLPGVKFHQVQLIRTDLREADLSRSDLLGAYMRRADLRGAVLDEANLFRANLSEATLDDATSLHGVYREQTVFHPVREPEAAA